MTEAKHTPGPWVYSPRENRSIKGGDTYIGQVFASKRAKANGHLIAAAPDLFKALAPLIVIALDNLDGMNGETREECERDIAKARAAIAKATGAEQ